MSVHHRYATVEGCRIFYREAGARNAPAVLLLHGFPSSSHMFRNLIPLLSEHYHVIAPDLPGFGFSDAPDRAGFAYTFDHLAQVVDRLRVRSGSIVTRFMFSITARRSDFVSL